MAIKGEVHVKSVVWSSKISLNDGRYVICPFECKIVGKAEGLPRVRASIHTFLLSLMTKNGESSPYLSTTLTAKPNTLTFLLPVVAPLATLRTLSKVMMDMLWLGKWNTSIFLYASLMVPSAQVHRFDPSYFAVKVHSSGALCSHPITHLAATYHYSISILKTASTFPCWHPEILAGRWWNHVSGWFPPLEIKWNNCMAAYARTPFNAQLHQSRNWRSRIQWTPRPLGGLSTSPAVEHPIIQLLDSELMPMSRRVNRKCLCKVRGYIASRPTFKLLQLLWQDIWSNGQCTDCCGSECKLLHLEIRQAKLYWKSLPFGTAMQLLSSETLEDSLEGQSEALYTWRLYKDLAGWTRGQSLSTWTRDTKWQRCWLQCPWVLSVTFMSRVPLMKSHPSSHAHNGSLSSTPASRPPKAEVAPRLFFNMFPTRNLLPPKAWVTGANVQSSLTTRLWNNLSPGRTRMGNVAGRNTRGARAPCSNAGKAHMTKGGNLVW